MTDNDGTTYSRIVHIILRTILRERREQFERHHGCRSSVVTFSRFEENGFKLKNYMEAYHGYKRTLNSNIDEREWV